MGLFDKKPEHDFILVEERAGGPLIEVRGNSDKDLVCPCGKPNCRHVIDVGDVLFHNGERGFRWLAKSAMHKEIRRGDYGQAWAWAQWFGKLWNDFAPKQYVQKVWSEETVNTDLAVRVHAGTSVDECVRLACASRKRWEFPEIREVWLEKGKATVRTRPSLDWEKMGKIDFKDRFESQEGPYEELVLSPHERSIAVQSGSLPAIMDMLEASRYIRSGESRREVYYSLRSEIMSRLAADGLMAPDVRKVFEQRYRSTRLEEEDIVLALLHQGLWKPEMADYHETTPAPKELYVPKARVYHVDKHVRIGGEILRNWQRSTGLVVWPGVDTGHMIDYRWSGALVGVFWRWCAWAQNPGHIDEMKWTDVVLTEEQKEVTRSQTWGGCLLDTPHQDRMSRMGAITEVAR